MRRKRVGRSPTIIKEESTLQETSQPAIYRHRRVAGANATETGQIPTWETRGGGVQRERKAFGWLSLPSSDWAFSSFFRTETLSVHSPSTFPCQAEKTCPFFSYGFVV